MKKNKKGFTLVELLAVIVVLGIIMVIAGSNLLQTKKTANIEEAKKMEKMIEDLGPGIYADEKINSSNTKIMDYDSMSINGRKKIYINTLASNEYLKSSSIKNPAGNETCQGYLSVIKTSDGPEFKGYICCPNLYTTGESTPRTNCSSF